jgi:hypothetical protein
MESLDILILGVEAAIALAGFAGIIATFQFSGAKEIHRADAVGLTLILQFSLLCALACSIPLALHSFGLGETTIWTIMSGYNAVALLAGTYSIHIKIGNSLQGKFFYKVTLLIYFVTVILALMNAMNAFGLAFHKGAGPHVASLVWLLCLAGFMFSRLLLRPIWRNVLLQEAAKLADATSG